ncbi:hypothetical protein SNE40_009795 [Patella caerulea]|uniref:Uncharacterized protein n=1 Tax=Patella caerulea TaxID=87958 RepID=A0AAN8JPA8_PATCE
MEHSELKLDRWRKRVAPRGDKPEASPRKTRRMDEDQSKRGEENTCLFCDGMGGDLHTALTFAIDHTVRQYALKLKDSNLLRKTADGDLVAAEAKYHKFFHDARAAQKCGEETDISSFYSIPLTELIAHIDEASSLQDTAPVFRLADLTETYRQRLIDLGMPPDIHVNRTRLKRDSC